MGAPWQDHPSWELVGRLSEAAGRDVAELLLTASAETLRATRNAQLATFALSQVALDAARRGPLAHLGPGRWKAVAGHSLGEYSALVAAQVIGLEEGARLVRVRGDAMQEAADTRPGTMAAVLGLELDGLLAVCETVEGAWVANDNAPGQVVVAGTHEGVEQAGERALQAGAKRVVPLQVGGAFHTPLMAPAQDRLGSALQAASFGPAACPVVSNVDASAHVEGFAALLSAQLCSRVRWRESLTALGCDGAHLFVELGPGTELSGMVRRTVPAAARANVARPEDLDGLEAALTSAGLWPA
jgi:[acyl-carrier-protein] S-malonyltransferase